MTVRISHFIYSVAKLIHRATTGLKQFNLTLMCYFRQIDNLVAKYIAVDC